jgi:hypothetical protein
MDETIKTNYFRVLTATIMYDKTLNPIEKLLYAEITGLLEATGECFASNQYFSKIFDRNESSVSTILHKLEKKGYITINVDRKNNNKRTIFLSEPLLKNQNTSFEKSKEPLLKNQKSYIYNNRDIITEYNKEKINKKEKQIEKQEIENNDFEEIWKLYKLRAKGKEGTKKQANKSFKKYEHDINDLKAKINEYFNFIDITTTDTFNQTKMMSTWLNQECFNEDWIGKLESIKNNKKQNELSIQNNNTINTYIQSNITIDDVINDIEEKNEEEERKKPDFFEKINIATNFLLKNNSEIHNLKTTESFLKMVHYFKELQNKNIFISLGKCLTHPTGKEKTLLLLLNAWQKYCSVNRPNDVKNQQKLLEFIDNPIYKNLSFFAFLWTFENIKENERPEFDRKDVYFKNTVESKINEIKRKLEYINKIIDI